MSRAANRTLTLLIGNRAGSFAGRLAGRLALAASTLFHAVFEACRYDCFYVFHDFPPNRLIFVVTKSIIQRWIPIRKGNLVVYLTLGYNKNAKAAGSVVESRCQPRAKRST